MRVCERERGREIEKRVTAMASEASKTLATELGQANKRRAAALYKRKLQAHKAVANAFLS